MKSQSLTTVLPAYRPTDPVFYDVHEELDYLVEKYFVVAGRKEKAAIAKKYMELSSQVNRELGRRVYVTKILLSWKSDLDVHGWVFFNP